MLINPYGTIKHGTLDDLFDALSGYRYIIDTHGCSRERRGYVVTAEAYLPLVEAEVARRREAGELTMAELMQKLTGKRFTILHSR